MIDRMKSSPFLGRQLSRLKMGQSYYAIIMSTVNAISLVSLAFALSIWYLILAFPILLLMTFGIGFYLDKYDIKTEDALKSNEMINRFLNTGDIKTQEFQLLQTKIILKALSAWTRGEEFNADQKLKASYDQYWEKWKPPRP